MDSKIFSGRGLRAVVIALVTVTASFAFMFHIPTAAAQAASSEIVIGLQNDMVNLNSWDPATNSVWKAYQLGNNFESLLSYDPDTTIFPILADPTRGTTAPGYSVAPDGKSVDVFIRPSVTFTDGQPMTADDVVFSFQTQGWGTYSTYINEGLWWDAPIWNHWTGGGAKSHIGVEKVGTDVVRFHLSVRGGVFRPYALFFFATMVTLIMPKHIWATHIDPIPPLNYTSLKPITDSADRSIDFGFGAATDIAATIGTGPWKLVSWARNQGSQVVVSDTYWGKGNPTARVVWRGVTYNFFPDNLRAIRFVIYSSLDVISLALQKGDIDTLIWPLLPGFLSQVRFNPAIGVEQVTDLGFFYLSFNLRRTPWNDLDLRKAVSMAIDKDYIVNTLMGGFGIKGTVPIAVAVPGYVNQSAAPPTFDLAGAKALLDSKGIIDRDGDGFREYKDGRPIKTTILTPPKDYDPIRADAGIMISNNLKKIGLNIDSAPTSFDTIVAKAFGASRGDFDIYVLGFGLPSLPELYIKDFFHSSQDVVINPAGSNSAGYNNPVVDALIDQALVTVDTPARVKLVKDIQGIVTNDIPWNVLYYRKNLNAYRTDRWVGWVNTPPQLYNFYSLTKLSRPGAVVVPPPSGALSVALTVPERAIGGRTVQVDVFASQNLVPASGATAWVNASFGLQTRVSQGATDVAGHARFSWKVPVIQGDLILKATAVKGGSSGSDTKLLKITVGTPAPIATLSLSTLKPVIGTGETTSVVAKVADGTGAPMSGVTVTVDKALLLGTITPASGTTDATGQVTFTYAAPVDASKFPNQHLTDVLKANVSVLDTVAVDVQQASLIIFVENGNAPNWLIVDVQGAPGLVLTPATTTTTVTVKVTDYAGAAKAGAVVAPVFPAGNVTVSPVNRTTDATGLASFTFTKVGTGPVNVPVRFEVEKRAFQVSDQVAFLVTPGTTPGYAAQIDLASRALVSSPAGSTTVTATVYNQLGAPATGAAVIFQINYGDLGIPAQFPWMYDYGKPEYLGRGLDLNFFGLGSLGPSFQNSSGQGSGWGVENFVEDLEVVGNFGVIDSCDPTTWPAGFTGTYFLNSTARTDAAGQVTETLTALPHKIDSPVQVRAWVGTASLGVKVDACNFAAEIKNEKLVIDSGMVIKRGPLFALGSVDIDQPIFTSADRTAKVTAKFYTKGGTPASSVEVILTRGFQRAARNVKGGFGGTILTDTTGTLTRNVTVPFASLAQAVFFGFIPADPRYAYGGTEQLFTGAYGPNWFFAPTFAALIAKIPFDWARGYLFIPSTVAFASAQVDKTLVGESGTATATITVTTGTDAPVPNATVWSGPIQATTDANGTAKIPFSATLGSMESLAVVQTPDGQVLRAWYGVLASRPVLTYGTITVTPAAAGQVSKISASVTNALAVAGGATVTVLVGGQAVASQVVDIGASATKTVTFDYVFDKAGTYQINIGDKSATATIPAPPPPDLSGTIGLGIGLLAVGLVVGGVVGIVLSRRRKPPMPAEAMMTEEEMKPPEGRP